jgi:ATP-binding cassette, subfamily B, bacterial
VKRSDVGIYLRLLREARPYAWHIAAVFLLSLLATPIALLAPLPLKLVVDHVVGDAALPTWWQSLFGGFTDTGAILVLAVAMLVVISLFRQVTDLAKNYLSSLTGERLVLLFRQRLFDHAQRLSLIYHDRRGTSDAVYRIQYDAYAIWNIALGGLTPFISSILTVAGMLIVTMSISMTLGLIAIAVAPPLLVVTHYYRKSMRGQWKEVKSLESGALGVVQEVLGALRVVQAFGQEDRESQRLERLTLQGLRARLRVITSSGGFTIVLGLLTTVGTAAVLYVGATSILTGRITLGELLLVMAYLSQLYDPLTSMIQKVAGLQNSISSAERAFELLDQERDVPESTRGLAIERARGALRFDDVWFRYEEGADVLRGVTFDIPPGARVGIAGRTGAGKTTLVNLAARFFDPTRGTVTLDGIDLRDYKLKDLRNQFTIVPQDPVLFSTSILENIEYGRPGASAQDVIDAATAANIHDFIVNLPNGYDTTVGERGMRLSGGERQRIALARAFLKNAPILVLDEPTSSIDVVTEASIVEAMERLMTGRTTLMIAHRLSTLESCDVLLDVEDGRARVRFDALEAPPIVANVRASPTEGSAPRR